MVITPVTYSQWTAPIVVVKRTDSSIQVSADFSTGLNRTLQEYQYPELAPDDIFTIPNGSTCFAKLDFTEAYLQIEVSTASRELLTINTHLGSFQFTRLHFGVKIAHAVF